MKMFCIKNYIVNYHEVHGRQESKGKDPWTEQRLTKGKIYEISYSDYMGLVYSDGVSKRLTYIDDCGTERSLGYVREYFITMEEWRDEKLNLLL